MTRLTGDAAQANGMRHDIVQEWASSSCAQFQLLEVEAEWDLHTRWVVSPTTLFAQDRSDPGLNIHSIAVVVAPGWQTDWPTPEPLPVYSREDMWADARCWTAPSWDGGPVLLATGLVASAGWDRSVSLRGGEHSTRARD